jgi:hypothetical protein
MNDFMVNISLCMKIEFMFRHELLKEMLLTCYAHIYIYIYIYVFDADDELRLHKRVVSINYLLRVVLDFSSVVFMFYFNWMRVTDYCILLIINLLILGATSPKGSGWEMCLEPKTQ